MLNTDTNNRTLKSRFSLFSRRIAMGKRNIIFCLLWVIASPINSYAQNTWTQKSDFGGTGHYGADGFTIGNKGYLGTGSSTLGYAKDFWEYDPDADTWTQKADFGGAARWGAVGFSIGSKGYLGTGYSFDGLVEHFYKDFWEYNPDANTWTQKADFGGVGRGFGVGFNIANKGYLGTGLDVNYSSKKDFWEYNPDNNTWTQKADFGGAQRTEAVGFSIGSKGYLGTGVDAAVYKDFWEYNPDDNTWTQRADFGGIERWDAVGFGIDSKGYMGTGYNNGTLYKDFWEYDPDANTWSQKADFGGTERHLAVGLTIGSKGYIGTGVGAALYKDFWEYTSDNLSCPVPINLSVTNITASSVKLKWDAMSGAIGYQVAYKMAGVAEWTHVHAVTNNKNINGLMANTKYFWKVKSICSISPLITSAGSTKEKFTTAELRTVDELLPQVSFQIYPNPAQNQTTIHFALSQPSHVCVKVYDVSGKEIACTGFGGATLMNDHLEQGNYSLPLNTSDFAKGVYLVRIICDEGIQNQKLMVQ